MKEKEQKLFNDFAPVSTEEWEARIIADLKGRDYEKALVWKTREGIKVRPYYRKENLESVNFTDAMPGVFPYVRGNQKDSNNWYIRQDILVNDLEEANKKALELLNKGVNSLGFIFDCSRKITCADLEILLKEICPEAAEINFVCPCENCNAAEAFAEYALKGKWNPGQIVASSPVDPLGTFVLKGKLDPHAFTSLKSLIGLTRDLSRFRTIAVHGKFFANSGASIVQELAFSLAQGSEYLSNLTGLGVSADEAAKKIKFNLGIGGNYFMEIAKLRAARLLWAQIVYAFGAEDSESAKMIIHSETNTWNKTVYDPYVNMLRTQTEAMSAVLGGSHSVTVLPFNAIYENPSAFSERIARNQQILLMEESHLGKIADPAGGSYYIETLTENIAVEAWKLFLEVEEKGGFINAFRAGLIQEKIRKMAAERMQNIALRRENLLGTNQFPNFSEKISKELDPMVFEPSDFSSPDAETETLKMFRGAQGFEILRYHTDVYSRNNKRPVAFMLTIGNQAMRKARAQFSCNFFAVAGFEVIDNNGFNTVEEGITAAKAALADIVVICSADEEYAEYAPKTASLLGNEILVIAGNPECRPELENKGILNFIHMKSNVLEELVGFQKILNIS